MCGWRCEGQAAGLFGQRWADLHAGSLGLWCFDRSPHAEHVDYGGVGRLRVCLCRGRRSSRPLDKEYTGVHFAAAAGVRVMPIYDYCWTEEIAHHVAEHGVSMQEFEAVVDTSKVRGRSLPTGRPCCWGTTEDGRYLICIYEYIDELTILPITAYEVRRPRRRLP